MTTTMVHEDTTMTPTAAAKPVLTWQDDPTIVLLNRVFGHAVEKVGKGGLGGYIEVAEADRPNPDEAGEPIQGTEVRVVVPTPEIAQGIRSQLGHEFSDITIEESGGPSTDTAIMLWVAGPHGRVGTYTNQRCRDLLCRIANNQENLTDKARRRVRLAADFDCVPHGRESTRVNYGCDCEPCKAAHAFAAGRRKHRKRLVNVVDAVTAMGGQVTAEPGNDDGETIIYAMLPTVDAAAQISRVVSATWANGQRQGFQVSFIVEAKLAEDLDLNRPDTETTAAAG
jgi:hypothetical protein